MGASSFYFAKSYVTGFGDELFFLKIFREAEGGGGANLLGSVVKKTYDWAACHSFPEPNQLTTPQLILNAIEERRKDLKIAAAEKVVLDDHLAGADQTVNMDAKSIFNAGVDQIPNLPISLGLNVDYNKLKKFVFNLGDNSVLKYHTDRLHVETLSILQRVDAWLRPGCRH